MKKHFFHALSCIWVGNNICCKKNNSTKTTPVSDSLPVTKTWIPDDIVEKLISQYGDALYSNTRIQGTENSYEYRIRIMKSGGMEEKRVKESDLM